MQACEIMSQCSSNDLQRLGAHHALKAIEGGVNDIRGIQDMGTGAKRKKDLSSSNPGKKEKTSILHEPRGQGQAYQDQGQDGTFSHAGQIMCYFFR